jgi:peptidoglycan-associated lipoprotein
MNQLTLLTLTAATVLAAGCASEPKPAARYASSQAIASDATPTAATPPPARQDTATPTSGSVHIDDAILRACGDIPVAHFAFDSARVTAEAASGLDALARCFATGPLSGQRMRLIGHADPRGETEYNFGLGQRRAGSVESYLGAQRVQASQMAASSRGQLDATGTDEAGWALDRKVDVLLVAR